MKRTFSLQFLLFLALSVLISSNIFAQKVLKHNAMAVSNDNSIEAINLNPLAECTGPGQMIFDDGVFENGYGWLNTVLDGRFVSLFTPPAYPWQFNTLCIPLTRNGTATDFNFDIVVYDGTGGSVPGTLIATIPGQTAVAVPTWPTIAYYEYDISSVPALASGSYYIGIKYNPSLYQNFYSAADQSTTTPLHTGYAFADGTWYTLPTLWTAARTLGYRTLGPSVGPGLATAPNPANFSTGAAAINLILHWTNPGGVTSTKVFFGSDPNSLSQIYSGAPVTQVNAPTPLNYSTFYFWRVDETSGAGTTYGTQWCFTTAAPPCSVYATPFLENFELVTFPPTCWTLVAGSSNWMRATTCSGYGNGTASTEANFYSVSGTTPFDLVTFEFNASTLSTPTLKFDYAYATYTTEVDEMDIYYSTNAGTTWTLLLAMPGGLSGILNTAGATTSSFVPTAAQWATRNITLPVGTNMVKFRAISAYGNNLYVDNIKVENAVSAPNFSITPSSKDFVYGTINIPTPNQLFTISNVGGGTLTINAGNISIVGTNANQFILTDANTYPINLTNGQSASVNVKFLPTSAGAKTASLQIIDNTTDATHTIPLSGRGIAVPFSDNFEGFTVGQQVACQDPINWTTWSILPCDATEDPYISSAYAHGGTKSAKIVESNDCVRPSGTLTTGNWKLDFWIYIPTGKAGYLNTLAVFAGGNSEWGLESYFDAGGAGRLFAGSATATNFTWTADSWKEVKVIVYLDLDSAEFYYDGALIKAWQWTLGSSGSGCSLQLGGNDFYGATANDEMYLDDYSITQLTTNFPLSVAISGGWNMVSVPGINPDGMDITHWWINHTGTVYKFVPGSGYSGITNTIPGQGYWEKNTVNQTYNTGDEWPAGGIQMVTHDPINAAIGWNMFGGYEDIVDPANLTTVPAGKIVYPIYKFVPGSGYGTATQIVPGYGYWVKVSAACQIIVPEAMAKDNTSVVEYFKDDWGRITITDATGSSYTLYGVTGNVDLNQYELPPLPPSGIFDIRYGSGRVAENLGTTQSIEMRGITYPVRVKVENIDITLQDETGTIVKSSLKSGEEIVISNPSVNKLMLTGTTIPSEYSLDQNYPNPFNPTTTINFSIPEAANVTLNIYNMLGQKVGELVNGKLEAGRYNYQWNAKNVATGMYIYELRTEKFVSVKKMLLLK